jgi:hypothetical protein
LDRRTGYLTLSATMVVVYLASTSGLSKKYVIRRKPVFGEIERSFKLHKTAFWVRQRQRRTLRLALCEHHIVRLIKP